MKKDFIIITILLKVIILISIIPLIDSNIFFLMICFAIFL